MLARHPPHGRRFVKGQSGNPGGRPKVSDEIRDLARGYGPACITRLAQMAGLTDAPGAESEAAQIAAIAGEPLRVVWSSD
jgi:hypothetical protein